MKAEKGEGKLALISENFRCLFPSPPVIPRKKAGLLETYSSDRLVDFPANI